MNKFCKDVIDFLLAEYSDAYEFKLEITQHVDRSPTAELAIQICKGYMLRVDSSYMSHIFDLYRTGNFNPTHTRYQWQEELIDIIEHG